MFQTDLNRCSYIHPYTFKNLYKLIDGNHYRITHYHDAREQADGQIYRAYFQIKIRKTNKNVALMPRGVDNLENCYINPGSADDEPAKRCRKNVENINS